MGAPPSDRVGPRQMAMERWIARCLRGGVVLSAAIVVLGSVFYFAAHGRDPASVSVFHGEPADLRAPRAVLQAALAGRADAVIQLGLLVLVATPVARVALSAIAFAATRDRLYAALSLWVLAVLVYSLVFAG